MLMLVHARKPVVVGILIDAKRTAACHRSDQGKRSDQSRARSECNCDNVFLLARLLEESVHIADNIRS